MRFFFGRDVTQQASLLTRYREMVESSWRGFDDGRAVELDSTENL
jgi:SRSO17 transposase